MSKGNTILTTYDEEDFEFSDPRQLPDGRIVTNVCNLSHVEPSEHTYTLFVDVEQDAVSAHVQAVECGGPSDQHRPEECKHRKAAAQCGELVGVVVETALDGNDGGDESGAQDGGTTAAQTDADGQKAVATDGGQPESLEAGQVWADDNGEKWRIVDPVTAHEVGGSTRRKTWATRRGDDGETDGEREDTEKFAERGEFVCEHTHIGESDSVAVEVPRARDGGERR